MLSKMMKAALTAALLSALSIPAMAADMTGKVNGRARAALVQTTIKDGASTMDMAGDGRLGYEMSSTDGDWTATGYVQLGLGDDGAVSLRDAKVTLENASMAITAGRQYPWGVTNGNKYLTDNIGDIYWAGEYVTRNVRDSFLKVGLKDVGLSGVLGMNPQTVDDTTTDAYNETVFAALYGTSMGALSINASYISVSGAIDEKQANTAGKDSSVDGYAQSSIAVGVGFAISETMSIALNIDSISVQAGGNPKPKVVSDQYMALIFDLGLSESSGVTVAYNTYSQNDGSSNPLAKTAIVAGFNKSLAGASIYVQYFSETEKDDDLDATTGLPVADAATSKVGAGVTYNF